MVGQRTRLLQLLVLLLLILPTTASADVTVSASLSPDTIALDQAARLTIVINGAQNAELELPEVEGVDIVQRGRNSSVNIVNSSITTSLAITCVVQAYAPGNYTIPPVKVVTEGAELMTEALSLTVTGAGNGQSAPVAGAPQSSASADEPFIAIANLEGKHYVGELIPITIQVWFPQQMRVSQISYPRLVGEGLVLPEIKGDPAQLRQTADGKPYTVLSWETQLTAIKEGEHQIFLEMDAVQLIAQRRLSTSVFGSQSPFGDDLFDDFFGTVRKKQITVSSKPLEISINPLPEEGRPADFDGAVGQFSLRTEVVPQQAEVGEPLTLTITIEGRGNIEGVEPPAFPESGQWKAYTPSLTSTSKNDRSEGTRQYEQAIVARDSQVKEVPPLSLSYFDPGQERYVTVQSRPLPVAITSSPTAATPVPPTTPTTVAPEIPAVNQAEGPAPLQFRLGTATGTITPLFLQKRFQIPAATLVLFFCLALILHLLSYRKRHRPADPLGSRRKQLGDRLAALTQQLETGDDDRALLAAMRTTIQEQLGTIWDCPPAAITLADIERRLGTVSPALVEIYRRTEEAAYGGGAPDKDALRGCLKTVKTALEKLL